MASRLLFVCLGNICRSPAAEGVFRLLMPDMSIDSAGTSGWHVGEGPYGPMQRAALSRGIDLSDQRARQITVRDFDDFDLILAMDPSNLSAIRALQPAGNETAVDLFTTYAPQLGVDTVPDPYYTRDFDGTLDIVQAAANGLCDALSAQGISKNQN